MIIKIVFPIPLWFLENRKLVFPHQDLPKKTVRGLTVFFMIGII